ncbi:MAG: GAF domain-containing protein [Armatimonadetes bacterium]|nr:GAF domain-containing protein [Armatimonadota bacterium]
MTYPGELTLYVSPGAAIDPAGLRVDGLRVHDLAAGELPDSLDGAAVWLVSASYLGADAEEVGRGIAAVPARDTFAIVLASTVEQTHLDPEVDERVFAYLNPNAPAHLQAKVVRRALTSVRMAWQQAQMAADLQSRDEQLRQLNQIGIALSAEREVDRLLGEILLRARQITQADAGSLYLLEDAGDGTQRLRFKLSQNDSFDLDYNEFTIPLNTRSLAGYTGVTGESLRLADVYELPADVPYGFSRSWDEETGYRTTSMLVVAMKNNKGEVRGVLQLINRKPDGDLVLRTPEDFDANVIEFDERCAELVGSLASQAAVALENQLLLRNIQNIFEGFLHGWVKAVEDRDPATAGHSQRVTALSLALAREVGRCETGPYAGVSFTQLELEELRYAGLLHDIGKIYVRAEVFLKAKKLYSHHLQLIAERFDFAKRTLQADYNERKLQAVVDHPGADPQPLFAALDAEYTEQLSRLDDYFQTILLANEPTVLEEDRFERLSEIAASTYSDLYGHAQHLLQPEELRLLAIRRGNLDPEERREIESHVEWSYRILERIPWTRELREIPAVAGAHHEKLDGSGYPNHMTSEQIPFRAKIMTIADIYDALTAADRPYKRAQSTDSALRILGYECKDNHLDAELLRIFCEREVWRVAHRDDVEECVQRLVYEDVA